MAILLTKDTPCIVQGITGGQGQRHARLMREYGTRVAAGTTPGRGGSQVQIGPELPGVCPNCGLQV